MTIPSVEQVRRASRRIRKSAAPRIHLTERDQWILESLGKMRFVTTAQLTRLHFKSRWGANKRLRKLLDAGFVRVWLLSLSEENVYSLDRAGARMLQKSGAGDGWTVPRGLDRNLDHLLAINQVRVSLAVSLSDAGGEIAWWRSDWELRTGVREQLVPDAFFEVRWQDGKASTVSLELDNGSRSPKKFLGKMLSYARLRVAATLSEMREGTIIAVCRERKDLESYREALRSAGLGERVWFATLGEVERGAADAIWSSSMDGTRHSLRAIGNLLNGKEGLDQECARMTRG